MSSIMNCYFKYNYGGGPQDHINTGPCATSRNGAVVNCCDIGDICLESGICQLGAGISTEAGASGYYLAGCTDSAFRDPLCLSNCSLTSNTDIVYDWDTGAWSCCGVNGSNARDCSSPTGNPLSLAPPFALKTIATVVASDSFLPMATGAAILTGPSGSFITQAPASDSAQPTGSNAASSSGLNSHQQVDSAGGGGLSAGAAAGIAVGAVLGLLLLALIAGLFIWRSRRKSSPPQPAPPPPWSPASYYQYRPEAETAVESDMQHVPGAAYLDHYAQKQRQVKATPFSRPQELPALPAQFERSPHPTRQDRQLVSPVDSQA